MNRSLGRVFGFALIVVLALSSFYSGAVNAAFAGNSSRLVYSKMDFTTGAIGLYSSLFSGDDEKLLLDGSEGGAIATRFSKDGKKITFTRGLTQEDPKIVVANTDMTNQVIVSNNLETIFPFSTISFGAFSSLNSDGTKVAYTAFWGDDTSSNTSIIVSNVDGSNRQEVVRSAADNNVYYPVFSPDGTKLAFLSTNRLSESPSGTMNIDVVNVDGSSRRTLSSFGYDNYRDDCERYLWVGAGVIGEGSPCTTIDWSPSGERLVFSEYEKTAAEHIAKILTVDLSGVEQTVYELRSKTDESEEVAGVVFPQYTPEGKILFRRVGFLPGEKNLQSSFMRISEDGSNQETLLSHSVIGENESAEAYYYYLSPTVLPGEAATAINQTTLTSAENYASITIQTPVNTNITCSSSIKESTQAVQDAAYAYPLGLVEFCFDTESANNQVNLTFVTDLSSDQVRARKYNKNLQSYYDVPDAVITEVDYEGKHALLLTYSIEDNGILDIDPVTGKVKDPIGLAVQSDELQLASTGQSQAAILGMTTVCTVLFVWLIKRRIVNGFSD